MISKNYTILKVECFKDITDLNRQIARSDLHAYNNPKIIMSQENIEKFKSELIEHNIEIPDTLEINTIIGSIPIVVEVLEVYVV